jgi:deferrochelatase/peroxidase EfeB
MSTQVSRRHSLVRRGRSYGDPIAPFEQEAMPTERGLLFVCVNANIGRQFEFVQQTWVNNPKFDGLYDDRDPLLGSHEDGGGTFTIPAHPFRERLRELPRFTRVRGGEYFFVPGMRALRFLVA